MSRPAIRATQRRCARIFNRWADLFASAFLAASCALGCAAERIPTPGLDGGAEQPAASDGGNAPPPLAAFRHDVLFVGNSYVYVNDVGGQYRALVRSLSSAVRVEEVVPGGYTLAQHAADANTDGAPLSRWLRTGAPEESSFDAVVLQEQSQIGGFPEGTAQRRASVAGASALARRAQARGAVVVLYLTWGRKRGDPANSELFGTYTKMQDRLDAGYLALAERLRAEGAVVRVAPVGGGFRLVYEDVVRAGGDPLATGSDFDALYDADGSHPSLRGAYLAACVIAGTTTGADVTVFPDEPTLGAAVSTRLRDVCRRALTEPRWQVAELLVAQSTLKPADARNGLGFGDAIALRADGEEVLVHTAPGTRFDEGNVRTFSRVGDTWRTGSLSVTHSLSEFAFALSGDNSRLIVGTGDEHGTAVGGLAGGARVYTRSGVMETLPRSVTQPGQRFGAAVAISGDGTRALVSATGEDQNAGSARVFVRRFDGWEEEARLRLSVGSATGRHFGVAVSLSDEGTRGVVGAPATAPGVQSHVGVFTLTREGWREEALLTSPLAEGDWFGGAVALSADGNRVLVGARQAGFAAVFARTEAAWVLESTLRPARELTASLSLGPPGLNGEFGTAVALSADGRRALVGAALEDRPEGLAAGSAFLFRRTETGYRQELLLLAPVPGYNSRFGRAVALSADGKTAAVAAPSEKLFPDLDLPIATGAVHVFDLR